MCHIFSLCRLGLRHLNVHPSLSYRFRKRRLWKLMVTGCLSNTFLCILCKQKNLIELDFLKKKRRNKTLGKGFDLYISPTKYRISFEKSVISFLASRVLVMENSPQQFFPLLIIYRQIIMCTI